MTMAQMYWIVMLDNVHYVFLSARIIGLGALLAVSLVFVMSHDTSFTPEPVRKRWFFVPAVILFFSVLGCFIPTTKQMAAILLIPKLANNERLQETGGKLWTLAEEWLEDLRPKASEELKTQK